MIGRRSAVWLAVFSSIFLGFQSISSYSIHAESLDQDDTYWSDCFVGCGLSDRTLVIKTDGDDVYAGGQFRYADGILCKWIARHDGTSWHAMGTGFHGGTSQAVYAIEVFDGEIYAAGSFTNAGDSVVNSIARWNGAAWEGLGTGTNAVVYCMAVYDGDLYVGGTFTSVNGDPTIQKLARYDGSSWYSVAEIYNSSSPSVMSMATDGTDLYIGGAFSSVDGIDCLSIAKFDGTDWLPLGGGLADGHMGSSPKVRDIAIDGSCIYAVGEFSKEGGTSNYLRHVGKWNGSNWESLGTGLWLLGGGPYDFPIGFAIECIDSNVYVGGLFDTADTLDVVDLACWDGGQWSRLGSGVNNLVAALESCEGSLYVGGAFTTAGGKDSDFIALWTMQEIVASDPVIPQSCKLFQNHPNPFNPSTEIAYTLNRNCHVRLIVYNVLGQQIATLVDGFEEAGRKSVTWNAMSLSSGLYFYQLSAGGSTETRKMVLLR